MKQTKRCSVKQININGITATASEPEGYEYVILSKNRMYGQWKYIIKIMKIFSPERGVRLTYHFWSEPPGLDGLLSCRQR